MTCHPHSVSATREYILYKYTTFLFGRSMENKRKCRSHPCSIQHKAFTFGVSVDTQDNENKTPFQSGATEETNKGSVVPVLN
jgi:hypothetical protein